jgi:hypothetical protein
MIYTAFDMVMDIRAGKPEGWRYFVDRLVPALCLMARHYGGSEATIQSLLPTLGRLETVEPRPEREVLVALREFVLAQIPTAPGHSAAELDFDAFVQALAELTPVEKQLVWFEALHYNTDQAAFMMRVSPETGARAQEKGRELLRTNLDHWTRTIIRDNGVALVAQARARVPAEPVALSRYMNFIDGHASWRERHDLDHSLSESWYEIDLLCRAREADEFLRQAASHPVADATAWLGLVGVQPPKPKKGLFALLARK